MAVLGKALVLYPAQKPGARVCAKSLEFFSAGAWNRIRSSQFRAGTGHPQKAGCGWPMPFLCLRSLSLPKFRDAAMPRH